MRRLKKAATIVLSVMVIGFAPAYADDTALKPAESDRSDRQAEREQKRESHKADKEARKAEREAKREQRKAEREARRAEREAGKESRDTEIKARREKSRNGEDAAK